MSVHHRYVTLTWQKYSEVQNQLSESSDINQTGKCPDTALCLLKYMSHESGIMSIDISLNKAVFMTADAY